jgi:hypothetical protein
VRDHVADAEPSGDGAAASRRQRRIAILSAAGWLVFVVVAARGASGAVLTGSVVAGVLLTAVPLGIGLRALQAHKPRPGPSTLFVGQAAIPMQELTRVGDGVRDTRGRIDRLVFGAKAQGWLEITASDVSFVPLFARARRGLTVRLPRPGVTFGEVSSDGGRAFVTMVHRSIDLHLQTADPRQLSFALGEPSS